MKHYIVILFYLVVLNFQLFSQNKPEYNPIIPDYIADPSVVMFNNKFYMYATTDINQGLHKMGIPVVWVSDNFVNWRFEGNLIPSVDWNKPYSFKDKDGNTKEGFYRYWAPGKAVYRNGKHFLFPTIVTPDEKMGTYVMVSEKPEGPFEFTNGKGLFFNESEKEAFQTIPLIDDIDGEPFIDSNGKTYIYWRRRFASAVNNDLLSLKGEKVSIPTTYGGYSEGPVLFKRNNLYYYVYTLAGYSNYCNAYMISTKDPLNGFEGPDGNDVFIYSNPEKNVWGPGHGNVFQMPGTEDFYFLYLEYGEGGTTRQVFANKMEFNENGTIKTLQPDRTGIGSLQHGEKKNSIIPVSVNASSVKMSRTVTTRIFQNPNELPEKKVSNRGGDTVRREFTYVADNSVDRSKGSQWAALENDSLPWIQFDFGKKTFISTCEAAFVFPTMGHTWIAEGSANGKKWNIIQNLDALQVKSPHTIDIHGKYRYLKITITEGYGGIWEVNFY